MATVWFASKAGIAIPMLCAWWHGKPWSPTNHVGVIGMAAVMGGLNKNIDSRPLSYDDSAVAWQSRGTG